MRRPGRDYAGRVEKLAIAWGVGLFLFCDGFFNWGLFQNRKSYELDSQWRERRSRGYGPLGRWFSMLLTGTFLLLMAWLTVSAYAGGGVAALSDLDGWLKYDAARKRGKVTGPFRPTDADAPPQPAPIEAGAPTPVEPPREVPRQPPPVPSPPEPADKAAAVAPAPTPPPAPPPVEPRAREPDFWVYDDDEGVSHMVDGEAKVPPAFRERARPLGR